MKFSKIIGNIDPKLVFQAEKALSKVFVELGTRYDNNFIGSKMGGDPLIFGLMYPVEHVCTLNIKTAATDGKRYYWNPKFILKQSSIGLRIVCYHEAWHAIYMHPKRRGSRLPKLWNIAVDYIVNGTAMDDFKSRNMDPVKMFTDHLGRFMTLDQYAMMLSDPWKKIPGFEDLNPEAAKSEGSKMNLPSADEDRDLTADEQKELEKRTKAIKFYYADPNLESGMKRPEKIYDYLYSLLPKCPTCGSVGIYKLPSKNKSDSDKDESDCCDGGVDIFDLGGTVDDHMDTTESEEKISKRISDAAETAKKMAGHVPSELERELGILTAPKISWKDFIRARLLKARQGHDRNDWTRFKTRSMFSGLLVPKRKNYYATFGCLLDTSGSMSKDDMAYGLSQLCSLDDKSMGTIVPADAEVYWGKAVKIKKSNVEELSKIKPHGGGGTRFAGFFADYEKNIGKCDLLIVITDGYLDMIDIADMKDPGINVVWILTDNSDFKAPFGRAFFLKG